MSEENEVTVDSPELHPEVAALDEKLAAVHQDEVSDADKEALNALIAERNEAYRLHHPPQPGEAPEG